MEQGKEHIKKGGRPLKSDVTRKAKTIAVCFSIPEYGVVKYRAGNAGLPLSVYCHDAILQGKVKDSIKKDDIELLRKLSGEANNLNQLVKLAHTYGLVSLQQDAEMILRSLTDIINQLSDDWKSCKRKKL